MKAYFRFKVLLAEKEIRDKRRWSFRNIRDETGIAASTLLRISNNQSRTIDLRATGKLCQFFECGVGDLIGLEPE